MDIMVPFRAFLIYPNTLKISPRVQFRICKNGKEIEKLTWEENMASLSYTTNSVSQTNTTTCAELMFVTLAAIEGLVTKKELESIEGTWTLEYCNLNDKSVYLKMHWLTGDIDSPRIETVSLACILEEWDKDD